MRKPTAKPPILSPEHAAFLGLGVSINVASPGPERVPLVGRACGCRVSADRRRVTVFLSRLQAGPLVQALSASGAIAVVFSQPSTHRTLQLKGTDARVVALGTADRAHLPNYRAAFAADLASIGHGAEFAAAVLPEADAGLVGVRFTPGVVFDQTPGRNAGRPLAGP